MKKFLRIILQAFSLVLAALLAAILGLWLAVIMGTDSRMKQSFADTLRLSQTVTAVAFELLHNAGNSAAETDYSLRPDRLRQATLMVMQDTGVSGIFRTGDMRRFTQPRDLKRLAQEFNRFLAGAEAESNRLIRAGSSFYLIISDADGQHRTYEYISGELFLNDGTFSRLLRRHGPTDETPLGMADLIPAMK